MTALLASGKLEDAETVLKNNIGKSSGILRAKLLALRATLEILRGETNVVVCSWPVSDQATAFMMVRFYETLGQDRSKAVALRSATLATREQAPTPRL
ncbi:MAG: CHAT domain-containing protein [Planctomycetota bacterium]|nr:CHAT domain-containing protein [Planctomycetota bacterium]